MTTCHVFIATSIDGFIAREDGGIDWLEGWPDVGHDYGYAAFLSAMDGIIMGRETFEKVRAFGKWPFVLPVVVMCRSQQPELAPDFEGDVRFSAASPFEVLDEVARVGWRRAYVDGGRLIQSFLKEGLVHDLIVTRVPILLGKGRPLFGILPNDVRLDHVSTDSYPSGFVQSRYAVAVD